MRARASRISYLHIHDNNGKKDEHLAIGDGCIPIRKVLDAVESQSSEALWALEAGKQDARAHPSNNEIFGKKLVFNI